MNKVKEKSVWNATIFHCVLLAIITGQSALQPIYQNGYFKYFTLKDGISLYNNSICTEYVIFLITGVTVFIIDICVKDTMYLADMYLSTVGLLMWLFGYGLESISWIKQNEKRFALTQSEMRQHYVAFSGVNLFLIQFGGGLYTWRAIFDIFNNLNKMVFKQNISRIHIYTLKTSLYFIAIVMPSIYALFILPVIYPIVNESIGGIVSICKFVFTSSFILVTYIIITGSFKITDVVSVASKDEVLKSTSNQMRMYYLHVLVFNIMYSSHSIIALPYIDTYNAKYEDQIGLIVSFLAGSIVGKFFLAFMLPNTSSGMLCSLQMGTSILTSVMWTAIFFIDGKNIPGLQPIVFIFGMTLSNQFITLFMLPKVILLHDTFDKFTLLKTFMFLLPGPFITKFIVSISTHHGEILFEQIFLYNLLISWISSFFITILNLLIFTQY
jgi:hypothetical protein